MAFATQQHLKKIALEESEYRSILPILPTIAVLGGDLHRITKELDAALRISNLPIFQRLGALIRIIRQRETGDSSISREAGTAIVIQVEKSWLIQAATGVINFKKISVGKERDINCPKDAAEGFMANVGAWTLPNLKSIARSPLIGSDGTIFQKPGYDPGTELFYDFDEWPPLKENLTREDAKLAIEILLQPVSSFPFSTRADISIYLSAVLTAIQTPVLPARPMHAFSAHSPGTGKSKLFDVVSTIATGKKCSAITWGMTVEEGEKRIGSVLFASDQLILIDNIEIQLASDLLCSYATQSEVLVRILGQS